MKGTQPISFGLVLLVMSVLPVAVANSNAGMWGGLGGAFSEMGRNLKDVVSGRSQGSVDAPPTEARSRESRADARSAQRQRIYEIQYRLSALGYSPGAADGLMGKNTAAAIRAFQRSAGLQEDGRVSSRLVQSLRASTRSTDVPNRFAGLQDAPAPGSSSIGEAFGNVIGEIGKAFSSSGGNSPTTRSGMATLAGQLNQPVGGGGLPGQSGDGVALALGALAATAAGHEPQAMLPSNRGMPAGAVPGTQSGLDPSALAMAAIAGGRQASPSAPYERAYARNGSGYERELRAHVPAADPRNLSYLDAMVLQQEREIYRTATDIDPQNREMARRFGIDLDGTVAGQLAQYGQYKRDTARIERITRQLPRNGSPTGPADGEFDVTDGRRRFLGASRSDAIPVEDPHKYKNAAHFNGVWGGEVIQPGIKPYSVRMVLVKDARGVLSGKSIYPELNCITENTLTFKGAGRLKFDERVSYGMQRCLEGSVELISTEPNHMFWTWFYPDGQKRAWAELSRVDCDNALLLPGASCAQKQGDTGSTYRDALLALASRADAHGLSHTGLSNERSSAELAAAESFRSELSVTEVSPSRADGADCPRFFEISGDGFSDATRFVVATTDFEKTLDPGQVSILGPKKARMKINTTSAPDTWTVRALNLDGAESDRVVFEVTASDLGDEIGRAAGVPALSNGVCTGNPAGLCNDEYQTYAPNQCVKYAKSYYQAQYPNAFASDVNSVWNSAMDFWKLSSHEKLTRSRNATTKSPPRIGDMLFFSTGRSAGHVAIVTAVKRGAIEVIQQNLDRNSAFATIPYGRDVDTGMVTVGSTMQISGSGCVKVFPVLGWLSPVEN